MGDDHEPGSRAVVLQGQHHKQTRPRLDYQNQAAEVMLSTRGRSPRVDEMPPSSAPETSPRPRGPFVASWPIFAPARGFGDAAGDAAAHRAVAHTAHRRGEERPRARRHDGVEAPLRHCARNARAAPPGRRRWPALLQLGLNCFLVRAICAHTRGNYRLTGRVLPTVPRGASKRSCLEGSMLRRKTRVRTIATKNAPSHTKA